MTTPQQQNHHALIFRQGMELIFARWAALQLAIEHQMGGQSTLTKASQMMQFTFDFFQEWGNQIQHYELEENLQGFFEENFCATLEDGSPAQVATALLILYADVVAGRGPAKVEELQQLLAKSGGGVAGRSRKVVDDDSLGGGGDDDDSDSDDSGYAQEVYEDDVEGVIQAQASTSSTDGVASSSSLTTPQASRRPVPIIDEDGFELVQSKKGNKRR